MIGEYYSGSYKSPDPPQQQQQSGQSGPPSSEFTREIYNPTNPVEVSVRGFPQGSRLRVVLKMSDKSDGNFKINLRNGDDILMHFNPRLKQRSLVFNSYYLGRWQYEEEAAVTFPFQKKGLYTVELIASSNNAILVYVDGQFLYEFHQRQSDSASSIEVGGDITIHSVQVK